MATDKLDRLRELAQRQRDLENEKKQLEEKMKGVNKELDQLAGGYQSEGEIPALMNELGFYSFELSDGSRIELIEELKPPSMAANGKYRSKMIDWLDSGEYKDVIKDEVKVPFRSDDEKAQELLDYLEENKVQFDRYRTVNPQTLKALLNELLEKGREVPLDDLGVLQYTRSKVDQK